MPKARIILLPILLSALVAGCATQTEILDSPGKTHSAAKTGSPPSQNAATRTTPKVTPVAKPPTDLVRASPSRWPLDMSDTEIRQKVAKLIPAAVKDRNAWAADLQSAFSHLRIPHTAETYCAVIAVIEQESTFQSNPSVPNLPEIVHKELERRAEKYGVPMLLISAALLKSSPNGKSYAQRIEGLKNEKQVSDLYQDMISELPFGPQLLADYNPVHTGGPMQVSVEFAEEHARSKPYPYPVAETIRDEVFTRRGGVYFGAAILLDYPAPYNDPIYRFADFNAGRYSSRNAAFQAALARIAGKSLALDGDLLRYEKGQPSDAHSSVETALLGLAGPLRLSAREIRRDLLLEKSPAFSQSPLYQRVFAMAEKNGEVMARQTMPRIDLKSPKISRKLTTEWFAGKVEARYDKCLARSE